MRCDDGLDALDEADVLLGGERLHLVAADVKPGARRDRGDLAHDIVDERIGDVLLHAERAEPDLDARVQIARDAVAVQLGIRGQRRVGVARHVDLRDDGDEALGRVSDDVRVLILSVEAAGTATDLGASTVRGEPGPRLDLDAPALIVGEVQV